MSRDRQNMAGCSWYAEALRVLVLAMSLGMISWSCSQPQSDPCEGCSCSGHGACTSSDGEAQCLCDEGYEAEGCQCLSPCRDIDCGEMGTCEVEGGAAICRCDDGYVPSGQGGSCIVSERWMVTTSDVDGSRTTYLTGHDCTDPEPICDSCEPFALSPSGRWAVVASQFGEMYLEHPLAIIDLDSEDRELIELGITGGFPFWADEFHIYYITSLDDQTCPTGGPHNQIRIHNIETSEDTLVYDELKRVESQPFAALSVDRLVFGQENPGTSCWVGNTVIEIMNLVNQESSIVPWTENNSHEVILGLLPDQAGFLVAVSVSDPHEGQWHYGEPVDIYQIGWDGERLVEDALYEEIDAAESFCATVSNMGDTGEFYCHDFDGRIWRMTLEGDETEEVICEIDGLRGRVADVWQYASQ